jgi:hypothetical protein|eukprot:COSAG01_NODE_2886_length_6891_cov_26.917780_3_plen_63_part_00
MFVVKQLMVPRDDGVSRSCVPQPTSGGGPSFLGRWLPVASGCHPCQPSKQGSRVPRWRGKMF